MKNYKKILIATTIVSVVTVNFIFSANKEKKDLSNYLLFQNIEALASGEEGWGEYVCYGEGTVDCPSGHKVEYYFNNVRIGLD